MNINQLNWHLMVLSMLFAMSFGWSESDSDDYDSPSLRTRRQLPESERRACMDMCMTEVKQLFQGEVSGTLLSERRAECVKLCQRVAELRAIEIAEEKEKQKQRKGKKHSLHNR